MSVSLVSVTRPTNADEIYVQVYTIASGHVVAYPLPSDAGARAVAEPPSQKDRDMSGLEALVAVATSEEKAATHTT